MVFVPPTPADEIEITKHWPKDGEVVLSVICITFNHGAYIEKALNGILMQNTTFRYEVFVRDDASTDGTTKIVEEYAARYPNIIRPMIEPENTYSKGVSPWAVIFPETKGKYLAHCEGDDYWGDSLKLQKQVDYLEAHPECVITFHDATVVDENNAFVRPSLLESSKRHYSKTELVGTGILPNLTRCYRNVMPILPNEFVKTQSGDTFICSLLSEFGTAVALDNIEPAYYRVHSGGTWQGIDQTQRNIDIIATFYWIAVYHRKRGNKAAASQLTRYSMMRLNKTSDLTFVDRLKAALRLVFKK